jgi:hypothetical protein
MFYKDLQKKTYPHFRLKIYTPLAQLKQTVYTQSGVTYAHVTKQNSYNPTQIENVQKHKPTPPARQRHTRTKNMMKDFFEQMGTMLNLLTTVLNKLK